MKFASSVTFVVLATVLACGSLIIWSHTPGFAQSPQGSGSPPARYQISAYAGPAGDAFGHGCYIIDQVTGQVWHARQGGSLEKVSEILR